MADGIFESERARKVFWALHKAGITRGLIRLIMPFYGKANHYNPKDFKIFAIGQSHLDTAWNWRWIPDTAPYKLSHTVGYNINRISKLFPKRLRPGYRGGYKFAFPAAAHYEYVEQHWPRAFERLKALVKEGRWELVGGSWIESDGNVPDGESFVRQRLYGQYYFISRFGKKAVIEWLPDSFGFCWTLPQIFKKSGAIGFLTSKMTWNTPSLPGTGAKFPFGWCYWQPPSGSGDRLLTYNFKHGWRGLEYLGANKELCRLVNQSAANDNETDRIFNYNTDFATDKRLGPDYIHEVLWAYGQGDGGHGPNDLEIIVADAAEQIGGMQQVKAGVVFKLIEKKYAPRLPVWADELYLEVHRGVQTTLHRLKQQNRNAETTLQILEKLLSLALIVNPSGAIPSLKNRLDATWKKVLFNQFHDILPGTSIQEVYEDTDRDYFESIAPEIARLTNEAWQQVVSNFDVQPGSDAVLIFYPHHWAGVAKIQIPNGSDTKILYRNKPAGIGFELCTLNDPASQSQFASIRYEEKGSTSQTIQINAPSYRCELNKATGAISSLRLANDLYEYASSTLNQLKLFEDLPPGNDAWEIETFYREKPCAAPGIVSCHVESRSNQIEIEFKVRVGERSTGRLCYIFTPALPYIECILDIDWQEAHRLLRVEFDTPLNGNQYTTGIPYGWIERPTDPQLPLQKGRWEAPGQTFISLANITKTHGLSVLVYDRYGYNCNKGQFGVSLLRAPSYGMPSKRDAHWYDAATEPGRLKIKDQGQHQIRWAIMPHLNDWKTAGVIQNALDFNFRPLVIPISSIVSSADSGNKKKKMVLPYFPIHCGCTHVNISVVKPPYGSHSPGAPVSLIMRLVEFLGISESFEIRFKMLPVDVAVECNLLEEPIARQISLRSLEKGEKSLPITIKPFEIKTFQIF